MILGLSKRVGGNTDMLICKPRPATSAGDVANVQARHILLELIKAESGN